MTAVSTELFRSRDNTYSAKPRSSSGTLLYMVKHAANEVDARTAALAGTPTIWDGKIFRDITMERIAPTKWLARCQYDDDEEKLDIGEYRISFDTSGGNVLKTVALAERVYPATAAPQHSAINVQDNRVQGVQWPVGALRFTITYRQPRAVITLAYARTLAALVGKTNDATFYGFGERELLFLAARGSQGSKVDPEISYDFLAGEHLEDFEIGGITVELKEAHEFLWAAFEEAEEAEGANRELIVRPKAIYVDQVGDEADYAAIGIGTGS